MFLIFVPKLIRGRVCLHSLCPLYLDFVSTVSTVCRFCILCVHCMSILDPLCPLCVNFFPLCPLNVYHVSTVHPSYELCVLSVHIILFFFFFLDASTHLYKRLCPSVRPLVGWLVGWSVVIELKSRKTRISAPAHPSTTDRRVSGLVGHIFALIHSEC